MTIYRTKEATEEPRIALLVRHMFPNIFGDTPPFSKSVAFLVGVSDYNHFQPLPSVHNDLRRMCEYLLLEEIFDEVYVLQDDDVTSTAINIMMFGYFAQYIDEQGRFLFYYSGHGTDINGVGRMEFSQADPNVYDDTAALSAGNWRDWSKALRAKQALFLFDACALGPEIVNKGTPETDSVLLRNLSKDKCRMAFAATRGDEPAHGNEQNSFFTLEFLRVVENGSADINHVGFMVISDIASAMQARLAELAREHRYGYYTTRPISLDEADYPGTFVFINPRINNQAEAKFAALTNMPLPPSTPVPKSGSSPVPNPTSTPATAQETNSNPPQNVESPPPGTPTSPPTTQYSLVGSWKQNCANLPGLAPVVEFAKSGTVALRASNGAPVRDARTIDYTLHDGILSLINRAKRLANEPDYLIERGQLTWIDVNHFRLELWDGSDVPNGAAQTECDFDRL